jgi:hypothetical protein
VGCLDHGNESSALIEGKGFLLPDLRLSAFWKKSDSFSWQPCVLKF